MRVTPFFLAMGLAAALDNGLARTPQLGWVGIEGRVYSAQKLKMKANKYRIPGIHLPAA